MYLTVGEPLAHHRFNPGEPGKKLTNIDICKKISTQLGPNPW